MVDPIEQARLDHAGDDKAWPSESVDWSESDWRAYGLERQRLLPVRAPGPRRRVALDTLVVAAAAELVRPLARTNHLLPELALVPVVFATSRGSYERDRNEARRRGVEIAGDGPDWPPPPMNAALAVGAGQSLALTWLRHRGRHPAEDAASVIVGRLIFELHTRWRWRHHPVTSA